MDDKTGYQCSKCSKTYKSKILCDKHISKCMVKTNNDTNNNTNNDTNINNTNITSSSTKNEILSNKHTDNNYDVNMVFLEGNKVKVEVTKQPSNDEEDDGVQVLKEILKPKVSESYQEEIDKLEILIGVMKRVSIPTDELKKDDLITQLRNSIVVVMEQSQNLIKEMKKMSHRNCYFKNNIMLASFILDKCRQDIPETDEEFESLYS